MVKDFTDEVNLKDKGVYMITHESTNIKYIGSTITTFQERWRAHLGGLKRGIGNRVLLNICNKYGIDGFIFYHYWFGNNVTALTKQAEILTYIYIEVFLYIYLFNLV